MCSLLHRFPARASSALWTLVLFAAACGETRETGPDIPPSPMVTLAPSASALRLRVGGSGELTVAVTRKNGAHAALTLSLERAPTGVTATGTIPAGETSGVLTVEAPANVTPQEVAVDVVATGDGALTARSALQLQLAGSATDVHPRTSYALSRSTVRLPWGSFAEPYKGELLLARVVADFDGDATPDLFLSPIYWMADGPTPRLYLGSRTEAGLSFADASAELLSGPLPHPRTPRKAVVGELNGDGRLDVFIAATGDDVYPFPGAVNALLLSGTDGTLAASAQDWLERIGYHHGAAAGDVDNDGDLDLFVTESIDTSFLLLNDGQGRFTRDTSRVPASLLKSTPIFTTELFDLDGDDFLDLIVGGSDDMQPTVVFWGAGTGTFSDARSTTVPLVPGYHNPISYAAEDVDGDGRRELVVGRSKGVYPADDFYKGYHWQVLKVNARAFLDVTPTWAAALNTSAMTVLVNDGKPTWTDQYDVIDWDGDGKLDLVTSDWLVGNFWARNEGSSFGALVRIPDGP